MFKWVFWIFCFFFFVPTSFSLSKKTYKEYKVDYVPAKRHMTLFNEFMKLHAKFEKGALSRAEYGRKMDILDELLRREPQWLDGYWLLASEAFQLGATYNKESELGQARRAFERGRVAAEKCHKMDRKNPLCRLFLGSCIGKIGTIDGVFASLSQAKEVHDLWKSVTRSPYNFYFRPNMTLQGSARYALGIFYRLVPDSFIIDLLFGVSGDIETSVRYHKESLIVDSGNPCSHLMMAVALICRADGEKDHADHRDGLRRLTNVLTMKSADIPQDVCKAGAKSVLKDPGLACGYTTAKQQELSEDQIEELKKPHKELIKSDKD